jgi:hypothetical protein
MKKFNLEALKSQFKTEAKDNTNNTGGRFYPFWNMEVGESAEVRFLPDLNDENPLGFLVESLSHSLYINGERKTVPCLNMYEKNTCPICKVSAAYYKEKDEDNGKKYWRAKQYLANVLVVSDPVPANKETGETFEGKVKQVSLGTKIYEAIKEEFESGSFDEVPFDYYNGTNFIIKKTQNGKYADYTRSKFARKPSELDASTIEMVQDSLIDLSTLLPAKPDIAKVEAMLQAALNGEAVEYDEPAAATTTKTVSKAAPIKTVEEVPEDEDDDDAEAQRILAQLQARRKQTAG